MPQETVAFFMRNFPFSFEELDTFSNTLPYEFNSKDTLLDQLNDLKSKYNFPSVENNIGSFLSFLVSILKPRIIFEMGSGYGHSAYWYSCSENSFLEKIILTERRDDLEDEFHKLPWPKDFKNKIEYFKGDAFERLNSCSEIDFVLIDGQKSDYGRFLEIVTPKLNKGAMVAIDNSYWRGSFLSKEMRDKHNSAEAIFELHESIRNNRSFESCFVPFRDGLSLLRKL